MWVGWGTCLSNGFELRVAAALLMEMTILCGKNGLWLQMQWSTGGSTCQWSVGHQCDEVRRHASP